MIGVRALLNYPDKIKKCIKCLTRLAMAQELSALYRESLNNKDNGHTATTHYVNVLSRCFDDAAIDITRQQVVQQLQLLQTSDAIDSTTND